MKSKINKWDSRFFAMCDLVSSWSEDQSRKVGAIIVGADNEIRATGYNGFPRGVNGQLAERHNRENGEKYFWFEHAERNAIYNAARHGASLDNCRIYCSLFPCSDCARAIIQTGIAQLNAFSPPANELHFQRSFQVSKVMLQESGVEVRLFDRSDFIKS